MKAVLGAAALVVSLVATAAWAAPADPAVSQFAQGAGLSNQFEIAEAKIILEDSTDPAARAFAQEMIHDHSMAQAALQRAAAPSEATTSFVFDATRQKMVDDLGLMDSPKLDTTYWADQAEAHAGAVSALSNYAASGTDPNLRAYARATLPVVLHHQQMLEQITGTPALF